MACPVLEEISPVQTCSELTSLSFCSCSGILSGFEELCCLSGLQHYAFNHGSADFNFGGFQANSYMLTLSAVGNHCLDLAFLTGCANIVKIDLSYSYNLESVEGIESCNKLKVVYLRHCRQLRYIDGLLECKRLRKLYLKGKLAATLVLTHVLYKV